MIRPGAQTVRHMAVAQEWRWRGDEEAEASGHKSRGPETLTEASSRQGREQHTPKSHKNILRE